MLSDATESPRDPLERGAPGRRGTDRAPASWFVSDRERANPATTLRGFTTGNDVLALVDGRTYFARLCAELVTTARGDQVYFLDFRGDLDERLDGPGTEVGEVLSRAARRGVGVFGLLWRAPPGLLHRTEQGNAEFARRIDRAGGQVLLDGRTRIAGSHHQKLVVIRRPGSPERDVAFVGGVDLSHGRSDTSDHHGDPQSVEFGPRYGPRPPWHDLQVEVHGPAVRDLEHAFRERWEGSSALQVSDRVRALYGTAYSLGETPARSLPVPAPAESERPGHQAVQVLRTYPARIRRYPFAPRGERSIAHAYHKAFARARSLVYLEDQYLWSRPVSTLIASALRANPQLRVIAVVPRYSDNDGTITRVPGLMARRDAIRACTDAGGDRFAVYDLENDAGTPIYVHSKLVIVDDLWAMIGSDNLNRRSWTHDSELSIAVLDAQLDPREPRDPAGLGDGARVFPRDLRLRLMREHLGRCADDDADLVNPAQAAAAFARRAAELHAWRLAGGFGPRPPGRVSVHEPGAVTPVERLWATPMYRWVYDPDGRPLRDRLRGRS